MNVDNEKIRSIIVKSVLGTLTEGENLVLQEWLRGNDQLLDEINTVCIRMI